MPPFLHLCRARRISGPQGRGGHPVSLGVPQDQICLCRSGGVWGQRRHGGQLRSDPSGAGAPAVRGRVRRQGPREQLSAGEGGGRDGAPLQVGQMARWANSFLVTPSRKAAHSAGVNDRTRAGAFESRTSIVPTCRRTSTQLPPEFEALAFIHTVSSTVFSFGVCSRPCWQGVVARPAQEARESPAGPARPGGTGAVGRTGVPVTCRSGDLWPAPCR